MFRRTLADGIRIADCRIPDFAADGITSTGGLVWLNTVIPESKPSVARQKNRIFMNTSISTQSRALRRADLVKLLAVCLRKTRELENTR